MKKMQPCLWFNGEGEDAAKFYTSVFKNSKLGDTVLTGKATAAASGRPEGSVLTVEFELEGLSFLALNGGPHFKINPSISFFVVCESAAELDQLWSKLAKHSRMDPQKYPFADKYGWCEDRFGVNWSLYYKAGIPKRQKISPALLFANELFGKAEQAIGFYTKTFPGSEARMIRKDEKTGAVLHSIVSLAGTEFVFFEGPLEHEFQFSPGVSFIVNCESQAEIDQMWSKLSAVPEAEACGWLADKYGVSWQIVPADLQKWITGAQPAQLERMMGALMEMKKIDLAKLQSAVR
jgi:predicted 3-demethylubiquinone-9 3-methyltransferase (glyoxalase superfamily)